MRVTVGRKPSSIYNAQLTPLLLTHKCIIVLVDFDQAGAEDGRLCNRICRKEGPGAVGHGGDGQAVHKELAVWERGIEGDDVAIDGHVGDWLDDRQVLLVDVDDGQG